MGSVSRSSFDSARGNHATGRIHTKRLTIKIRDTAMPSKFG